MRNPEARLNALETEFEKFKAENLKERIKELEEKADDNKADIRFLLNEVSSIRGIIKSIGSTLRFWWKRFWS